VAFAPTVALLYDDYTDSIWTNTHGLFVPIAIVYLGMAILRREAHFGEESSAWGFLPITLGLALVVLDSGVRTAQLGALGIAISLPGFSLLLLGARRTKALALPLFLAFFLVPIPTSVADFFYFPTGTAVGMVPLLERIGLPVLRERTVLTLPQDVFGISANCSGFATFYGAMGVAVVLAAYSRSRVRAVLLLLAPWPFAMLANILRSTVLVAFCAHHGIGFLDTPLHGVSGIAAFWLTVGGLLLMADWPTLRKSLA
jgi:exosortase